MYRITNRSAVDGVNVTVGDALLSIPPGGAVDLDVAKADVVHLPDGLLEVTRVTKAEAEAAAAAQVETGAAAADDGDNRGVADTATEEKS